MTATNMAHRAHAMSPAEATNVAHRMHAVRSAEAGPKARTVTDTSCSSHLGSVAFANVRGALAMNACGSLAVHRAGVLRMHGGLAGAVCAAYNFAEVQPVVVRNLSPAFVPLELTYDSIEALPRCVSQQVRFLQSTPAKSGRRPFCLQRSDGNSGFRRNSIHIRSARSNSAKQQNGRRYDYT